MQFMAGLHVQAGGPHLLVEVNDGRHIVFMLLDDPFILFLHHEKLIRLLKGPRSHLHESQ
jgi:hypothetical protein